MRRMKQVGMSVAALAVGMCATSAQAQWFTNGNKVYYQGGKVGIGTANPNSPLQVVSAIGSAGRPTLLVKMTNTNPEADNAAIRGINRGTGTEGYGIWGSHDGAGIGVGAFAGDGGWGLFARANGDFGRGIVTRALGTNGIGIHARGGMWAGYFEDDCYMGGFVGINELNPTHWLHLGTNSAAKPTSNTWTISSDERLKKNITPIKHALESLLALHGVTYQWKDPSTQGDMAGTYTGMIAQDVETVFPEWVREDANGFKTLTVIGFEGIVVEALRELRNEKDAEIKALRDANESLQARVSRLERLIESSALAQRHEDTHDRME